MLFRSDTGQRRERGAGAICACFVDFDIAVVGDLVEEAEEGELVLPESRRAVAADVHDGDGGGGPRRQHQPLPEVPAAGEPPGFVPSHSRRRRRRLLTGYTLVSRGLGRAAEAGMRVC